MAQPLSLEQIGKVIDSQTSQIQLLTDLVKAQVRQVSSLLQEAEKVHQFLESRWSDCFSVVNVKKPDVVPMLQ